ncbi:MAG: thioredoxin [Bacteroidales bacterium]|nr:thioredoxin [Bacteroidales bacterium]MDD4821798.1 thioredoxin [Bacteroidales bacterium]
MEANFNSLIKENRPVVVDFHATWCGPCKAQAPILKKIAEEFGERVRVIKIDVDRNRDLAGRYEIQSVPTLMVFKNGQLKHKQAGVHSKAQLLTIITQNL